MIKVVNNFILIRHSHYTKMEFKVVIFYMCFMLCQCMKSNSEHQTFFPCIRKSFSASSFVCVCNSTYCDTTERETSLQTRQYAVYESTKSGLRMHKTILQMDDISTRTFDRNAPTKLEVEFKIQTNETKQTIIGFGGTFTDAAGRNIASLPDTAQDYLIQSYFGPDGIEYSLGRIPIASNDMSSDVYSYDFIDGDIYLSKFTIDETDHLYKIPYIDKAVVASGRNVSLFGSPWSSPDWMKSNDNMVGYGTVLKGMAKVYANYLARFLAEYEGFMLHGRMWGLTPQSGPVRSCDNQSYPVYQSMCWTAETMRNWTVHDLKPSLKENNYDYIKLLVMDDNRDQLPDWAKVFDDEDARNAIDGFAVQGYHDHPLNTAFLSNTHSKYPNKILLGSEFTIRQKPVVVLGSWERGEILASSLFQDMSNYMSGFVHYNLAVNTSGGPSWVDNDSDSPIIVDSTKKVFYKQPMFYVMGHFSKFLPPGSKGINLTYDQKYTTSIPAVAFARPDDTACFIIANMMTTEVNIQIKEGTNLINHKLKPSSIQTFTWAL